MILQEFSSCSWILECRYRKWKPRLHRIKKLLNASRHAFHIILRIAGEYFGKNIRFLAVLNGFSFSKSLYRKAVKQRSILLLWGQSRVFVPFSPNHCFFCIIDLKLILRCELILWFQDSFSWEIILSRPLHVTCTSYIAWILLHSSQLHYNLT